MMDQSHSTRHIIPSHASEIPDGYIDLLSTPTIFAMDLIGKNLLMNGIDAQWYYSDSIETENYSSRVFVKQEQREQALSILTTLDLLDFTTHNGK